LTLTILCPWRA